MTALCDSATMSLTARKAVGWVLLLWIPMLAACATDVANRYYGTTKYPPEILQRSSFVWQRPTNDLL